jgi:hypothetical protein
MHILNSSFARRKVPHNTQKYLAGRCASCDAALTDPARWICDRCRFDLLRASPEAKQGEDSRR